MNNIVNFKINAKEYERWGVATAMIKFGGAFVESLGWALSRADFHNANRIKNAFPDIWELYAKLHKEDKKEGQQLK